MKKHIETKKNESQVIQLIKLQDKKEKHTNFVSIMPILTNNKEDSCAENYECINCGDEFVAISDLDIHKSSCSKGSEKFSCEICKKHFSCKSYLTQHIKQTHIEVEAECTECGLKFKSHNSLYRHKRAKHTITHCACQHCDLKFTNKDKYLYHLKTHDRNRQFCCKYCDKTFLQKHHLENHERTHTGKIK